MPFMSIRFLCADEGSELIELQGKLKAVMHIPEVGNLMKDQCKNQVESLTSQLDLGVRFFDWQIVNNAALHPDVQLHESLAKNPEQKVHGGAVGVQ